MNEFQEQLLENYHNPKNFGKPSFTPTHTSHMSNLSCGDDIEIWLKVNADNVIEDISFVGEGCSISIGTASLLYSELVGKNLDILKDYNQDSVVKMIGIPLTISRIKCATLSLEALNKAINQ